MQELITHFHFLRPYWLIGIIPVVVIIAYSLLKSMRESNWQSIINENLLPYLIENTKLKKSYYPLYGLLIVWLLMVVAMAGPTWEKRPTVVRQDTSALVLVWDLSPSMNATDVKPSRLTRSKLKLIDLLNSRNEGLTALVVYAGSAHVVTPLTDDNRTIVNLVKDITTDVIPEVGSNPELAYEIAQQLFLDGGHSTGDILFLSDGIPPSAVENLKSLQNSKFTTSMWGIGTADGAPIPLENGEYARGDNNEIIFARFNDKAMSDVAIQLGGMYIPFSDGDLDIDTINGFKLDKLKQSNKESEREFDQWVEFGPFLLLFTLPFLAFAFRRGWLLSIIPLLTLVPTDKVQALQWQDLWKNDDQQAQEILNQDPQKAADQFSNSDWKATANYRAENYQQAEKLYQENETAENLFNLGNSLAHLGKYDEAINAYEKAKSLDSELTGIDKNIDIVKQLKELENQQNQQNQDGQNKQDENQEDSENQNESDQQDQQNNENQQSQENQNESQQGQQEQQQADQQDQQQEQNSQQSDQQQDNTDTQNSQASEMSESQQQELQENYSDQQADEEQTESVNQQTLSAEEIEDDQALEQWLRKVPDDPGGLLRNKFHNEQMQRIRSGEQQYRYPGTNQSDRY